jgi:hypothetical protein
MDGEQEVERRAAAVRSAIVDLVEAATAAELVEPVEPGGEALARVRAAGRGRDRVRAVVGQLVDDVVEAALDRELMAARTEQPRGASWRELGAVLGMSHQALSKRARRRGLDPAGVVVIPRGPRRRIAAPVASHVAAPRPAGHGAAFWQAQNPR